MKNDATLLGVKQTIGVGDSYPDMIDKMCQIFIVLNL
jgi:predicted mannosyl-3-phosphoglycerate phosphatase (HAD superfamily)